MIRTCLLAVVLAAPIASAQVGVPTTPVQQTAPRTVSPATRPSPAELHEQAVEFMRQEKFDKATPLLNRAYNETPPAQRPRPLVLNRAILDLVQKTTLMRGIKDLSVYFTRNPAPDEQASNILGSMLELAADNPKWRDGPIYGEAFREFARREAVLERHRPGFRRWGPKWITQAESDDIRRKDQELAEQITGQARVINRLRDSYMTLTRQFDDVTKQVTAFGRHVHVRRHNEIVLPGPCARCEALDTAQRSLLEINADLQSVTGELRRASSLFDALQARLVKPQWPRRYDPIPVDAPPPAPPQHPAVAAMAEAEEQAKANERAPATTRPAPPPATRPSDLFRQ